MDATGMLLGAVIKTNPTYSLIEKVGKHYFGGAANPGTDGNQPLAELELEAKRQELAMAMATSEAKAAQELAIAQRILQADEVEIQEFYDVSGEGVAGLKANSDSVSMGASGSGKKVTHRIVKFRGFGQHVVQDQSSGEV